MDILSSIPILKEEDIGKFELSDVMRIHESLTYENPLTYKIFLSKRPDIIGEEKEIYLEIIRRLEYNNTLLYKHYFNKMFNTSDNNNI